MESILDAARPRPSVISWVTAFFVYLFERVMAVQGPFVLPTAKELHASLAGTIMAVAIGESVANTIQPFFALPLLAIAGIPMGRTVGFMMITFLIFPVACGASLLFLLPAAP
jgi:short-chain fatty acids transporter